MMRLPKTLAAFFAAAFAAGIAASAAAADYTKPTDPPASNQQPDKRRHGGMHGPDQLLALCSGRMDAMVAALLAYGRIAVAPRPDQRPAWDDFAAAAHTAGTTLEEACGNAEGQAGDAAATHRLAQLEILLEAGHAAVVHVRPAFDALYAKLDDGQRATLDELLTQRGSGRRMGR